VTEVLFVRYEIPELIINNAEKISNVLCILLLIVNIDHLG
jgi:hypothetical protein